MGFFKDLKADISQAVNELLPDEEFWGLDDTEQQTSEYEMAMGDSDISVLASLLQNEMDSGNQEADDNQEEFVNLDSTNDDDIEIIAALHEMIATEEPELGTESISMPEEGEEDNIELMARVETEEPIVTEQLQKTEDIVEVEQSFEAEMKELTEIAPML